MRRLAPGVAYGERYLPFEGVAKRLLLALEADRDPTGGLRGPGIVGIVKRSSSSGVSKGLLKGFLDWAASFDGLVRLEFAYE